jgi:hypothetical protein
MSVGGDEYRAGRTYTPSELDELREKARTR